MASLLGPPVVSGGREQGSSGATLTSLIPPLRLPCALPSPTHPPTPSFFTPWGPSREGSGLGGAMTRDGAHAHSRRFATLRSGRMTRDAAPACGGVLSFSLISLREGNGCERGSEACASLRAERFPTHTPFPPSLTERLKS